MTEKIEALLEQRGKQWGDAVSTHARIAQVWSGILDKEITPQQVALCMTGLKLVRASINPDAADSYDDGHGYLTIAEQIIFGATEEQIKTLRAKLTAVEEGKARDGITVFNSKDKKW